MLFKRKHIVLRNQIQLQRSWQINVRRTLQVCSAPVPFKTNVLLILTAIKRVTINAASMAADDSVKKKLVCKESRR